MSDAFAEFDDGVPNVARIYDYLLGGSHNFAVDRARAEEMIEVRPSIAATVRANRRFLRHAVERCLGQGVRQFLDLGSGIPTVGNVHEVAHHLDPEARVAYVDHEAVAVAHSEAILAPVDNATISAVDYRDALVPGSMLVLTHASDDYPDHPEFVGAHRAVRELYDSTSDPIQLRSREEIRMLVRDGGFEPDADGLVEIGRWAVPPQEPLGGFAVISEPLASGG